MRFNKRRLAALILISLIVVQLQPVLQTAITSPVANHQDFTFAVPANNTSGQVSVYIPAGNNLAGGILSQFLSTRGIKLDNYGLLSSFNMPGGNSSQIVGELNFLKQNYGVQYYTSNKSVLAYPSVYGNIVTPSQQTASEYVPSNIRTAYNFTYPLNHNITGKGTTIALVDAYGDPMINYDVSAFDNITGLPPTNLSIVYPNNYHPNQTNSSWAIETSTDVEWAHALAPGAKIVLVIAQNANVSSLDNAVSYVIAHRLANIISLSWGLPESQLGLQGVQTFTGVYKYAADNGITVLAATGDFGAYDQQNTLTVNFPSSDPYVLAIGGTSLYPVNNQYEQSAWGGTYEGSSYGSGGGYSRYFSAPWWQVAQGFGSPNRGTPDVSMNANKNTGMLVVSHSQQYKIGGTSIASPMWADVISLMDQAVNRSIGFTNPMLYQIANSPLYKTSFEDITTGDNGYYNATPGWDPVTGLGTPKVGDLINATKSILSPYGAIAFLNGSGYNSTGISADLKISSNPSGETFNGSTFYYIGSYLNSGNYVKFGVMVNNTTVSRGYMIAQNGKTIQSFQPLQKYVSGTYSYNLSLNYSSGSALAMSENGHSTTLNLFLENTGRMVLSFGTEQVNSTTNMTQIPSGSFQNLTLINNGTDLTPVEVYESHYSGTGIPGYSTVQINSTSNSNYTVKYDRNPVDKTLTSFNGNVGPSILYNLTYATAPVGTFSLINSGYSSAPEWFVNGTQISGNGTVFHKGGLYNITALYGIGFIYSATRFIQVPFMNEVNVTVSSPLSYYDSPAYTIGINHFYSETSVGKSTLPSLTGSNYVTVRSNGFETVNLTLLGGASSNLILTPKNVTVSVFAFPGNATVSINGTTVPGPAGLHSLSMIPGSIYVNVSSGGYQAQNISLKLMPGEDKSIQVSLIPYNISGMAIIRGNVTDGIYHFAVAGVNVSLNNSGYAFTNSSGYFIMYLPAGEYNVSFNQTLYTTKYLNLNVTSETSANIMVQLYPKNINPNSIYNGTINRLFPLLFYFGYISWTKYTGPNFAAYKVFISTNPNMLNPGSVTVTSQNTTFAFLSGIVPGQTYYITVSVYLQDGEIYGTQPAQMGYSNPFVLLANVAIVAGVIIYAVMAVRYVGRMRKKRTIRL